ncbi:Ig-like domain-containing protein [Hyalangium versicolor]|uniref:Ig-like domain-containing protein n=1 Tax=Hyalangium versicolor TaxID=2861190 RepID=UPI001CCED05A|nr:Ig-like domain-containing protein [Hyalangium versicolor]
MKQLFNPVMVVAALTLVSACKKVERIEVTPKQVSLTKAGQTETVKASGVTADGQPVDKVKFEFSSSDKNVATVDANGTVTAVKSGAASIEVKGNEKSAKVPVEVVIPGSIALKGGPVALTGIGTKATIDAAVQDDAGRPIQGAQVEFTSADTNVAEVSGNTVTAKGVGTTKVKATSGELSQTIEVTVKQPEVATIAFEGAPASLKVGESATLNAVAKAADGAAIAGITPTFTSSNEKLATVDATGKVTAVKVGAVTITAKSGEKSADAKITIKKK